MSALVDIGVGPFTLVARLEEALALKTCAAFRAMMPYEERLIHVRWSGEGCSIPMRDNLFDLPWENHSCYPRAGQFAFYPGDVSETEILLAYGEVRFSSKFGQLPAFGKLCLWEGAQSIAFRVRA
jgi:hypothetical protein